MSSSSTSTLAQPLRSEDRMQLPQAIPSKPISTQKKQRCPLRLTPEKQKIQMKGNEQQTSPEEFLEWIGVNFAGDSNNVCEAIDLQHAISKSAKSIESESERKIEILFVIDFECNQPEEEIIEFPIIVLDVAAAQIVDSFHAFVRPTTAPQLTKFIQNLTNISQSTVDQSQTLTEVLASASTFMAKHSRNKVSAVLYDCPADAKFLSNEVRKKKIPVSNPMLFSPMLMTYINLRHVFPLEITGGVENISLQHALDVLNIGFIGRKHTGRDDATNIARVCIELINRTSMIFTTFMRQSQFIDDSLIHPRRAIPFPTFNDLFTFNKFIIAIDLTLTHDQQGYTSCKNFSCSIFNKQQSNSNKREDFLLISEFTKVCQSLALMNQHCYEIAQLLEQICEKHQIISNNTFVLLHGSTSVKSFIKFTKQISDMILPITQTKNTHQSPTKKGISLFQFKRKIFSVSDLIETQLVMPLDQQILIQNASFPQSILNLMSFFEESKFQVKEKPSYFSQSKNSPPHTEHTQQQQQQAQQRKQLILNSTSNANKLKSIFTLQRDYTQAGQTFLELPQSQPINFYQSTQQAYNIYFGSGIDQPIIYPQFMVYPPPHYINHGFQGFPNLQGYPTNDQANLSGNSYPQLSNNISQNTSLITLNNPSSQGEMLIDYRNERRKKQLNASMTTKKIEAASQNSSSSIIASATFNGLNNGSTALKYNQRMNSFKK